MPDEEPTEMERLGSYLADRLGERVVDTAVLEVGLNRLIRVKTADDRRAYVVRQPNEGRAGAGFVDVQTEHEVVCRLDPTRVATPAPVHLCGDSSVLGTPFSMIEHVPGEPIGWDESLPVGYRTDRARRRVGRLLIDELGTLHAVDANRFEGVCGRVSLREQVDRTLEQLEAATSTTGHDPTRLWRVADWLRENVPEQTEPALTHGDYKPDNVLLRWTERPAVGAVIDWETAKVRDPLTELGYFLFYWREASDPAPDLGPVTERHPELAGEIRGRERAGFWPFTKRTGSPSRRALVERWEAATGKSYEHDRFYRAFGAVMLATVWEQLYASSIERGETTVDPEREAHVEYIAALAEAIRDGCLPLSA